MNRGQVFKLMRSLRTRLQRRKKKLTSYWFIIYMDTFCLGEMIDQWSSHLIPFFSYLYRTPYIRAGEPYNFFLRLLLWLLIYLPRLWLMLLNLFLSIASGSGFSVNLSGSSEPEPEPHVFGPSETEPGLFKEKLGAGATCFWPLGARTGGSSKKSRESEQLFWKVRSRNRYQYLAALALAPCR